jgi:sRNA-binding carbon storage regulator CsrA
VSVGIDAPPNIPVHRHEIAQRLTREGPNHGHQK